MAEENTWKMSVATAVIGAVGAVGAAIVPMYLNRPAADPAPAEAKAAPGPAPKAAPDPVAKAAPDPAPGVTPDPVRKRAPNPVARAAPDPAPRHAPNPVAKGSAVHTPKADLKSSPTDFARLQGHWAVVGETYGAKVMTKDEIAQLKPVWAFEGTRLTITRTAKGEAPLYRGTFKLRPNVSPKNFDFTGKNRKDEPVEMLGIYDFDGPFLILRFRFHRGDSGPEPGRPKSFKSDPGPTFGTLVRLRHVKD